MNLFLSSVKQCHEYGGFTQGMSGSGATALSSSAAQPAESHILILDGQSTMLCRHGRGSATAGQFVGRQSVRILSVRPTSQVNSCQKHAESCPSLIDRIAASTTAALLAATMVAAPVGLLGPVPLAMAETQVSGRAVEEYMALEASGKAKNIKSLNEFRSKYRMKRDVDGRMQLKSTTNNQWWSVRLDMEVPGALLLRDPSNGNVFAVQTESVQQIDLSDDYICLLMFADGGWEKQMAPIEFTDESGKVKQLQLKEGEFREVIGILKEAGEDQELDEAP